MPKKFGRGFDVICKQEVFSASAYLYNVIFDSFRQTYSQPALTNCGRNFVFRPNRGASDQTAGHNLYNVSCPNCDDSSYAYFDHDNPDNFGWFGGCG